MHSRSPSLFVAGLALACSLCACGMLKRDNDAAAAKAKMFGMTKEEVLACMGPPKKKASEGATEVWSFQSTDGRSDYNGHKIKTSGYDYTTGARSRNLCTVNVVMKDGIVKAVHYLGPTGSSLFTTHDQCGYAVEACVE